MHGFHQYVHPCEGKWCQCPRTLSELDLGMWCALFGEVSWQAGSTFSITGYSGPFPSFAWVWRQIIPMNSCLSPLWVFKEIIKTLSILGKDTLCHLFKWLNLYDNLEFVCRTQDYLPHSQLQAVPISSN